MHTFFAYQQGSMRVVFFTLQMLDYSLKVQCVWYTQEIVKHIHLFLVPVRVAAVAAALLRR
jgi:hypothetical protein